MFRALLLFTLVFFALAVFPLAAEPATATPQPPEDLTLEGEAKEKMDDLQSKASAVQGEIDRLDVELERAIERNNETIVLLDEANRELTGIRRDLQTAMSTYEYRLDLAGRRIAAAYKAGKGQLMAVLLTSNDFSDFLNRLTLITKITLEDHRLAGNLEKSANDAVRLEADMRAQKERVLSLRARATREQDEVESRLAERKAVLAQIDVEIKEFIEDEERRQEEERRRREAELQAKLAAMRKAAVEVSYTGPLPESDSAVVNQLVETAAAYLGIPYKWGGEKPATGFDCSGLTLYVYRQHGVSLPHFSGYQANLGAAVPRDQIAAGDLVAFGSPVHHVGLYIGDDQFIHAPRTGDVVKISRLSARNDLVAVRRFPLEPRKGVPDMD